jgi:hypothetical protein
MRILTLGDSWTYGPFNNDPPDISWPSQMSKRYNVEVVNLARSGGSNARAARIGIEELTRDANYDYVVFPLAPASRTEILKHGKWHQIWPNMHWAKDNGDKIFTEYWHSFNDVQNTIMLCFYFSHSLRALGIPLYITGLSMHPMQYAKELKWITDYKDDFDFNSLEIPNDLDIGIKDLDRKLKSLRAIHQANLKVQPEYLNDVVETYILDPSVQQQYQFTYSKFNHHHLDKNGYTALCDYFAGKIGLH